MKYAFHPAALEEYRQTTRWYADREQRVARQFVASVEDAIARIVEAPLRWRIIDEDVRRCLTRVFPFGILYTIERRFRTHLGGHALQSRAWVLEISNHRALARPRRLLVRKTSNLGAIELTSASLSKRR